MNPTLPQGTLQMGNRIATPNANVTPAQTADASASGWKPIQVNTTIDGGKLGVQPFAPPPADPSTSSQNSLGAAVAPAIPSDSPDRTTALNALLGFENEPGKEANTVIQEGSLNVQAKLDKANALNAQAMSTGKHYDDQINALREQSGGTTLGNSDAINSLTRQKNSELADIAIQSKIANDDYQGAMDIVTKKVAADAEVRQNKIDSLKDYIAALDASPAEKAKMTEAANKQQSDLDLEKQEKLKDYQAKIDAQDPSKQADIAYKKAQIANMYSDTDLKKAQATNLAAGGDQNKLEQAYRQVLLKPLSNRSGGLGLEDAKVSTANHLSALMNQFKDANGNFNIPASQYNELTLGLARMVSPNGQVGVELQKELTQRTARGDLSGALTYLLGTPMNGSTQDVFKLLAESIDRQANTAVDNRQQYMDYIQGLAPTNLDQDRKDALEKNTLVQYKPILGQSNATYMTSPDGKQRVDISKLSPSQLKEAKDAGFK